MLKCGYEDCLQYNIEKDNNCSCHYDLSDCKDYWKLRCKAAEKYIEESPCDPDIYDTQIEAHNAWKKFK